MRYNGGMTTMVPEIYDALIAAGADEEKSRAAAQSVARLDSDNYAAKSELEKVASKIESGNYAAKADLEKFATKSDLNQAIANLRADMYKMGMGLAALHIASVTIMVALLLR